MREIEKKKLASEKKVCLLYQNWTLVSVPDTTTWFLSYATTLLLAPGPRIFRSSYDPVKDRVICDPTSNADNLSLF